MRGAQLAVLIEKERRAGRQRDASVVWLLPTSLHLALKLSLALVAINKPRAWPLVRRR